MTIRPCGHPRSRLAQLAALAATVLAGPALAQDDALYPPPAAPDASYLRVYVEGDADIRVGEQAVTPGEGGLTSFVEIAPGPVTILAAGQEATIEAAANKHYIYIVEGTEGRLLEEGVTGSASQADLVFYNLTDIEAVDLVVPEADATALAAVPAGEGAAVALRAPMTLDFEVRNGEEALAQVPDVELLRATATTILLTGGPDEYAVHFERNTYAE